MICFLGLWWAATRLFSSIRTVLDLVLESQVQHGYIKAKLMDLGLVLVTGLLFLLSILLAGLLDLIKTLPHRFSGAFPGFFHHPFGPPLLGFVTGFVFSGAMFFLIFRLVPSRRPPLRPVVLSSLVTAVFWELAKFLFRLYVEGANNFTALYGSLGLLAVFIFWVYYSSLIFVLGGELIWRMGKKGGKP